MLKIGKFAQEADVTVKILCHYDKPGLLKPAWIDRCMAGHEVENIAAVPEGMERWDVLEQTYAVFPCTLPTLHETYEYIFKTWLPQSDYERADGPDFEYYSEEFDPATGEEDLTIYVPVKQIRQVEKRNGRCCLGSNGRFSLERFSIIS